MVASTQFCSVFWRWILFLFSFLKIMGLNWGLEIRSWKLGWFFLIQLVFGSFQFEKFDFFFRIFFVDLFSVELGCLQVLWFGLRCCCSEIKWVVLCWSRTIRTKQLHAAYSCFFWLWWCWVLWSFHLWVCVFLFGFEFWLLIGLDTILLFAGSELFLSVPWN